MHHRVIQGWGNEQNGKKSHDFGIFFPYGSNASEVDAFSSASILNFSRVGGLNYYTPAKPDDTSELGESKKNQPTLTNRIRQFLRLRIIISQNYFTLYLDRDYFLSFLIYGQFISINSYILYDYPSSKQINFDACLE